MEGGGGWSFGCGDDERGRGEVHDLAECELTGDGERLRGRSDDDCVELHRGERAEFILGDVALEKEDAAEVWFEQCFGVGLGVVEGDEVCASGDDALGVLGCGGVVTDADGDVAGGFDEALECVEAGGDDGAGAGIDERGDAAGVIGGGCGGGGWWGGGGGRSRWSGRALLVWSGAVACGTCSS